MNWNQVREGYSVFVVRGSFPKPGSQFFERLKRQDRSFAICRCELEEEHNHKKLLEAVQGRAASPDDVCFFRKWQTAPKLQLNSTRELIFNHGIFGYHVF